MCINSSLKLLTKLNFLKTSPKSAFAEFNLTFRFNLKTASCICYLLRATLFNRNLSCAPVYAIDVTISVCIEVWRSQLLPLLLRCYKNILHVDFTSSLSFANYNLSALDVPSVCATYIRPIITSRMTIVGVKTSFIIYHN